MNLERVRPIIEAVLYEGYILYPYRPDTTKNRQRWTFGGVYPQNHHASSGGVEPWYVQSECLVEGGPGARIEVHARFLQPVAREVGELASPVEAWPCDELPQVSRVASLTVGGVAYHAWQEAIERDIALPEVMLQELAEGGRSLDFTCAGHRDTSPLRDEADRVRGVLTRTQHEVRGRIIARAQPLEADVHRLTVRIENLTAMDPARIASREEASLYCFASTHLLLGVRGGAFVSLMDPPGQLRDAAAACVNQGAFPVLVGPDGARDLLLASPIILYDYPQVAAESPGDLFDGTEIDEILSLSILAMTDEEKREMAANDPRAAALLARTQSLRADDFLRLHGTLRSLRAPHEAERLDPRPPRLAHLRVPGRELTVGERVRLRPRGGADVMDLVLDGRTAVIEAIERDFEDRVHVAVALDDDPGRDFGLERMPGHRFFFSPEEIEPLERGSELPS